MGPEFYPYGRRDFVFRDPDGYLVLVSEAATDFPTDIDL
jgi:hypothetical protein